MVERAHVAFPDYHEELEEMIAEGDKVVVRLTITGTQHGQWGTLASQRESRSASRRSSFCASSMVRSPNSEGIPDNLAALRQLGVVPTPPPPRE